MLFTRDKEGVPINWKTLNQEQIGKRFQETKAKMEKLSNILKEFPNTRIIGSLGNLTN